MEARIVRLTAFFWVACGCAFAHGALFKTPNFVVNAPTDDAARRIAQAAEHYRKELALEWLGEELPNWYRPCQVSVKMGPNLGAGGATTFSFESGEVFGWDMRIQGSLERLLDSVVPHEVSHTIFASHFRRPLPRWADEGAATLVEHESERRQQSNRLNQIISTREKIPLRQLLAMTEYPKDMNRLLYLYAEGYSLSDYLVQRGGEQGKAIFLKFLQAAHQQDWDQSLRTHYNIESLERLDEMWSGWVVAGSPKIQLPKGVQLASVTHTKPSTYGSVPLPPSPLRKPSGLVLNAEIPNGSQNVAMPPAPLATSRETAARENVIIRSQSPATPPPLPRLPRKLRNTADSLR